MNLKILIDTQFMKKMKLKSVLASLCMCLSATAADRPNILFILTDDQTIYDLKAYDEKSPLQSPVLDKLAAEGMVIDGAYHMGANKGAVCTPSRHMIMSGRSVWRIPTGVKSLMGNASAEEKEQVCPSDLENNTIAAVFNRAGYDTMRTCKKGNSYSAANKQFTICHDVTKRGGTDESGSAWHAERVLDYLNDREQSTEKKPFLIYYGFSHPHDPREGKSELLANYGAVNHRDKTTPPALNPKMPALPVNYLDAHPFEHGHIGCRDEINAAGVWRNRDVATIRNENGRELACSENIDIQIGRVLDKLEAMGELDNTYIIYTADHGIAIGRHGLQGKQNLYEHSLRVPMIVKGPGIPAGSRAQGNVYLMDVLSTLCDMAGIPAPDTNEGISFKPVLEGKKDTVRDSLYGVYCGGTKPGIRSVRKGDWKLIQYDGIGGTVQETQLFNLAENPHELLKEHHAAELVKAIGNTPSKNQVNLADDPAYAAKLKEMEELLLTEMRKHDDPYRMWNQPDEALVNRETVIADYKKSLETQKNKSKTKGKKGAKK